ncbi:MAG: hypothetical protein IIC01_06060 [Planctomycetes bacterium]|nr:hypothetical protein [Planctomycetota bacterium]
MLTDADVEARTHANESVTGFIRGFLQELGGLEPVSLLGQFTCLVERIGRFEAVVQVDVRTLG